MDWSNSTWWWIAAGMLIAAELVTGTFYLLMLAIGVMAGALAAHLGLAFTGQLLCAALIGGGGVVGWYLYRRQQPGEVAPGADPEMNLDIGGQVQVAAWNTDGHARVVYRGAGWDARYGGNGPALPGEHVIVRIDGSHLVLERPPVPAASLSHP